MADTDTYKKGIDVSRWQGHIDWSAVAASGIEDAIIKMAEGATYTDPRFEENWQGATSSGLSVGVYQYFRALSSTPKEQADGIKKRFENVGFDLQKNILAIDIEPRGNIDATPDQMADHLYELLKLIEDDVLPGHKATIYTSPNNWNTLVNWGKYDFSDYPLWVAHWEAKTPRLPKSWEVKGKTWSRWQHTDKGTVPGINAPVDLDWVK